MRITNSLFYTNAANDYQRNMQELYKANTQISSGLKIQNSYEDSGTYVDAMRLNYEVATLDQVKQSSSKAQTYANNTDQVFNQFTDALTQFKTKLIQSANQSNSSTSLNALANELQVLRDHMVSLGNTSINGKYLFSGSAVKIKPVNSDGTYNGNAGNLEATIGSGVKLPYNINGQDLFLGSDSEYNKTLSTNVQLYNQIKLHPTSGNPKEVYIDGNSTIRELVGDSDTDLSNNGNVVFYLSGRKSDGSTFSTNISLAQTSKMSELTNQIGQEYGNTSTNKVVDVSINNAGQIEIKDLNNGNSLLEMNIFGAVDRSATGGTDGNAKQTNIDDLVGQPNVDIIKFMKSDYLGAKTASTIASREDINNAGTFRIGYPMHKADGTAVESTTLLSKFMPNNVNNILIGATSFSITGKNVQNLMSKIETVYNPPLSSGSARLENGQIIIEDSTSTLNATLTARDSSTNSVEAFTTPDAMNYERRGFEKVGNKLIGNISQIVKGTSEYATSATKLSDVSGVTLDNKRFKLNGRDDSGNKFNAQIDFASPKSTFTFNSTTYDILDSSGQPTTADNVTYQQLSDIVSMVTSNKLPATNSFIDYNLAIKASQKLVDVKLDYKGRVQIQDKNNTPSKIEFSMFDSNANSAVTGSALTFMANDAITTEDPKIDFYKNLDNMIEAVRSGQYRMDANTGNPRNLGIENSIARLDHLMTHVTKEHTKIGSYSNALSQANERSTLLSVNVQTIRSDVIDVDVGKAYMKFNQLSNSYQAMLSTVAKINSMTLLNYM